MTWTNKLFAAAALGITLGASACTNEQLFTPPNFVPIDPLFERYVSMGNSITAGFQSGGINDSLQRQSYAALLANRMGSPFFMPLMNRPGCPAPFTSVFTQTRIPGPPCALRATQVVPPPYISNTAVPGAEVVNVYNNLDPVDTSNALTTFFLGGLTQTQMMRRARPTFVSVWIGNNDVLGAATYGPDAGDSTRITPAATFATRYGALLDSMADVSPRGALLVGVANVSRVPYFSRGSVYFAIKAGLVPGAAFPANFQVAANCAPARGDSVLVPFPFGLAKVDSAANIPAGTFTLDCAAAQVIIPRELVLLLTAVTSYNATISTEATARGWAYFNPNTVFDSIAAAGSIPPFPFARNAAGAVNPCAGTPASTAPPLPATPPPFGLVFSCDGVHPSAATHRLIANKFRLAINAAYGTTIPQIF